MCCCPPGWSGWPLLLSGTHNPTKTSLWHPPGCYASASSRPLGSHRR
uniref:Uncharacterized protein n=1 Tax=Anguilla anguilla TaxID=7936 RepID=A0A0E9XG33_ANGAN